MGEVDRRCGVGSLKKSASLQKFAGLGWYSVITGLVVLGVTATYSYMSSVQTTSQAVFSFSSLDIGVWYAMFEVGSILSNIFASYFLTNKNIPNVLGIGVSITIIGCLMHGLPHFFMDYADKVKDTSEETSASAYITQSLCQSSIQLGATTMIPTNITTAAVEGPSQNSAVSIIYCIAGFLMGLGYAPFWCLGLVYIDDNIQEVHDTTKYVAVILAFYTIGPVLGFGSGSLLLKVYVTLGETYLTENDDQWIGAYWIGYLVFAIFLLILCPFVLMFPKRMPIPAKDTEDNVDAMFMKTMSTSSTSSTTSQKELTLTRYSAIDDESNDKPEVGLQSGKEVRDNIRSFKGFFPTLGRLLINPLYILEVLGSCCGVYFISGWIGFLPKYFEEQFNLSTSSASLYAGVMPPLFSAVAVFIGGFLSSKYRLNTQQNATLLCITTGISAALIVPTYFLVCEQFPAQDSPLNSTSCVSDCGCNPDAYVPLCYEGVTYKSPCMVGCDGYKKDVDDKIIYTGCLCNMNVTMTNGVCQPETCNAPYIYVGFAILSLSSYVCCASAAINIIMRAVDEEDKSLALGVQSSLNSLLAWIPAPILYGLLIDSVCNIWEYPNEEVERGYCMEYFNDQYRSKFMGTTIGMLVLTCIFCGIAIPVSYMKRYRNVQVETAEDSKDEGGSD